MSVLRLNRAVPALRRSYATAANVAEASGVKVVGIENGLRSGTTSITVAIRAGSRYEPAPGVAHVLKNFAFKSTGSGSALRNVRESELYGGVLSTGLSREHLFLNAEFLRGEESYFLPLLASVLSSTQFFAHEFSELVLPNVQGEALAAAACPIATGIEAAHALAFRRGLGNSLFASPAQPVALDAVKSFAQNAFAKSNVAVIGQGISTEALSAAVGKAFGAGSGAGSLSTPAATYYGGEDRIAFDAHHNPTAQPTLVIAYGAASATSPELQVLSHLLGGESSLKWTPGSTALAQAAAKVPGASVRTQLYSYSDASLLAVVVQAPTDAAVRSVASEVAAVVKGAASGIKDDEVKRAIAKAEFAEASKLENSDSIIAAVTPAVFGGALPKASSFSGLSASAIANAAESLLSAKPTVVAVGNTHVLPYADEIGL